MKKLFCLEYKSTSTGVRACKENYIGEIKSMWRGHRYKLTKYSRPSRRQKSTLTWHMHLCGKLKDWFYFETVLYDNFIVF